MYQFKDKVTGKIYKAKNIISACKKKDKIDNAYGSICTTYPEIIKEEKK